MKPKKNKEKGNELSYKMFEKKGKKLRKQNGFPKNSGQWNKATLDFSSDPLHKHMLNGVNAFNQKVEELDYEFGGIPEDIDRKCIEATGMNLKNYTKFWNEFILRAILHQKGVLPNPLDYIDTLGAYQEGKKSDYQCITQEEYEHFIKCFDIYSGENTESSLDFQSWLITTEFFGA